MDYKIIWKTSEEDFSDAIFLRDTIFIGEQNVSADLEHDEFDKDPKTRHIILYDNQNNPIGVGRLIYKHDNWYFGRVGVLKDQRKSGYGSVIMKEIILKAKEIGAKELFASSQMHALDFYKKLGFIDYGEIYQEANIDHKKIKYEFNE